MVRLTVHWVRVATSGVAPSIRQLRSRLRQGYGGPPQLQRRLPAGAPAARKSLIRHEWLERHSHLLHRSKNRMLRRVHFQSEGAADLVDRMPFEMSQHERGP